VEGAVTANGFLDVTVRLEVVATVISQEARPLRLKCSGARHCRGKPSVTSRVWMDCGAMARDGKCIELRRDAANEVLQVCVLMVRTCGGRVAETDGEHATVPHIMLFVDRVAKGFRRLERRRLRRRDDDRSPVRGLRPLRATRLRTANFPNPAMAAGWSRASASAMAEKTASTIRSAAALVEEVSAATCETSSASFMVSSPLSCGRTLEDGASPG